jgi:hypothetical protein
MMMRRKKKHRSKRHRRKPLKPNRKIRSADPDILGSWSAMLRAAKTARQRSITAGAPFIVVRNGEIVDLNQSKPKKRKTAWSQNQATLILSRRFI